MKKVIAITGGYASGKSALLQLAKNAGYETISCDEISKSMQKEEEYLCLLKKKFGGGIFDGDKLCRNKLADLVFRDKLLLQLLNEISHAEIEKRLCKQIENCKGEIIFVEIPLLFETNMQSQFFCSILVTADRSARIERAKIRDNTDEKTVLQIMQNQMPDSEKAKLCDYLIENNGDFKELQQKFGQVLRDIFEEISC